MTIVTRRTTLETAEALHEGSRKFDFVPKHVGLKVGSTVRYGVVYKMKEVPHPVQGDRFRVTYVLNDDPRVYRGLSIIGLEKIEQGFE